MARMVFALQTKSPMESHRQHAASEASIPKPKDVLKEILQKKDVDSTYHKYSDLTDLFVKGCVSSYSFELMTAVRQNDISVIRKLHESGHNLQCSNKFQESIVHAAARRGCPDILKYLKEVAGVSLRVCCDGGRTPLHDAAWTANPDFTAIRFLLEDCPDLLLVTDKRGFTPLDFVPKEAHDEWNTFLNNNKELVTPRGLR